MVNMVALVNQVCRDSMVRLVCVDLRVIKVQLDLKEFPELLIWVLFSQGTLAMIYRLLEWIVWSDCLFSCFRHSQKPSVPECPLDTVKLWSGYSLLNLHGNARASGQELGSTGSCMQRFSTMPVIRCDISQKCSYAQDQDNSYWLSTFEPMNPSLKPVNGSRIKDFISRCSACESIGNVCCLLFIIIILCYNAYGGCHI